MSKYKIYTIAALIIMSVCFTLPVLGWHGAKDRIANGDELPSYSYTIYDLYSSFQYKNHLLSKEVASDLAKMIEQKSRDRHTISSYLVCRT